MKRAIIILISAVLLAAGCGKKQEAAYEKGTKEYEFFKKMAEKLPVLDPDKSEALIRTSKFTVYTADVMPELYRLLSGHAAQMQGLAPTQLMEFVRQSAKREAEKKLFLEAAAEQNITVSDDTLEIELNKIYTMYGGKENFIKRIESQGISFDFVKQDVKDNLIIQKYFSNVVYKDINVSDEELKKVYDEGKTATVRHILMLTQGKTDEEKAEIRKKMEDVLKKARAGEDFAALAKEYSEDPGSKDKGGLYEKFPHGQMVKPFEDAAFGLPIGSISDIIETQYGFHIMKIIDREKEDRSFDEAKADLKQTLMTIKKREAVYNVLESLKKKYKYEELFSA